MDSNEFLEVLQNKQANGDPVVTDNGDGTLTTVSSYNSSFTYNSVDYAFSWTETSTQTVAEQVANLQAQIDSLNQMTSMAVKSMTPPQQMPPAEPKQ